MIQELEKKVTELFEAKRQAYDNYLNQHSDTGRSKAYGKFQEAETRWSWACDELAKAKEQR